MSEKKQSIAVNKYHIIYFLIALSSLAYVIYVSDAGSLWYDEMHSLGAVLTNKKPNSSYITVTLMRIFAQHMPYGQRYVYLLPEIFFAMSVYMIGLVGKRLRNGETGIYASALLAFSPYLIIQSAHEFRQYFMLLFASVFMYYLFMKRQEESCKKSIGFMLLYGLCNMMLLDAHEYGKLVAGFFILLDICLLIAKKIDKCSLISFVMPVGYILYWLTHNEIGGLWNNYSFTPNPTPSMVFETVHLLLNKNNVIVFAFGVGLVYIFYLLFEDIRNRRCLFGENKEYYVSIYIVFGVFSASIVYSTFINPNNSLYLNRYFVSVVAYMYVIAACGMDYILSIVFDAVNKERRIIVQTACVLAILCMGWQVHVNEPDEHPQKYRQTAEFLRGQEAVYEEDTVVFIPDNKYVEKAWDYYFTENGKSESVNMYNRYNMDLSVCEYQTIYVVAPAFPPTEEQQEYLNENYMLKEEVENLPIKVYERVQDENQ